MPTPLPMRRGERAALAALALLILTLTITPITNNDIFLHLKTGETILKTGSVPRVDDYSALARGRPFIAHEWLAGVLFKIVQTVSGWNGLILLKALVAVAVAGLLYATARRLGAPGVVTLPALAFVMILAASRVMERPHILSYLLTAAFLLLLARRRSGPPTPLWSFVPLQILWANLHGGFILGPAIVALAAAGAAIDSRLTRRPGAGASVTPPPAGSKVREALPEPAPPPREALSLALLSGGLLLASLVNPYGPALLKFPFELTGSFFMGQIYEWLPPLLAVDFRTGSFALSPYASTYMARFYVVWILFGLVSFGLAAARFRRLRVLPPGGSFPSLLFAGFVVLSLRMNRNVVDFALATLPGVAASFAAAAPFAVPGGPDDRSRGPGAGRERPFFLIASALALLALWYVVNGFALGPSVRRRFGFGIGANIPVAAAAHLERIGMRGSVFNSYPSGAYLIYRLYPEVRVAMDSRNDVYGEDLYREYTRALTDPEALQDMLRRIDAGAILLEWPTKGMMTSAAVVHRLKDWVPVFFDDTAVTYLRLEGPWRAVVAKDGYDLLDPALYRGGVLRRENASRALAEADRALSQARSYIARVMRIDALYGLGRDREALEEERRILAEDPPLFHIYTHLGWIRLARGDRAEAAARFRRALRNQPDSEVAKQGLALAQGTAAP